MFIKLAKFKFKIKPKKAIKSLAIFLLITSWLLTGWPGFQLGQDFIFPPKIDQVDAANYLTNPSFTGGTTNWTLTTTTYDSTYYQDSAGSVKTATSIGRKQTATGTAVQAIGTNIETGSTVALSIYWSKQCVAATCLANTIQVDIAKPSAPTTWITVWTDTTTPAAGSATSWTGPTGLDISSNFTETGTYSIRLYTNLQSANNAAGQALAWFDNANLDVTPPAATTTLSTSTDPAAATVAPASGIRSAGQFAFTTSAGTDTITALTLTLAGSPAGSYAAIDSVSIRDTSCSGTLYFSAVTPSSDSVSFSGGTALSATTGGNTYYVCVTPKDHTLASGTYSVSPYVSSTWTSGSGNTKAGTDSNANALTIDNTAPNGATSVSGTAGNASNTLNWTTSSSSDFNTTSGSVVYRWQSGSAGSETPSEGSTPSAGDTNGTATAACVISSSGSTAQSKIDGTGGSTGCTTTALTNGLQYIYKVFQKDNYGNYDSGVTIGPLTPSAASASFTQNKYRWYYDNDSLDPTNPWGNPALAENSAITVIPAGKDPPDTSQELRLRVNLVVNTAALSISSKYFKLEYKAGTDGSCTSGSWTDVGTGNWVYATSSVADQSDINPILSDTTALKGEQYVKSKPSGLNQAGANIGEIIEYDFHVIGGTATPNTTYSFRVVETDSAGSTETVFDAYTNCPTLTTEPGTADLMRHGNVFTNSVKQGFFWAN
jgi:hypothetical protein